MIIYIIYIIFISQFRYSISLTFRFFYCSSFNRLSMRISRTSIIQDIVDMIHFTFYSFAFTILLTHFYYYYHHHHYSSAGDRICLLVRWHDANFLVDPKPGNALTLHFFFFIFVQRVKRKTVVVFCPFSVSPFFFTSRAYSRLIWISVLTGLLRDK